MFDVRFKFSTLIIYSFFSVAIVHAEYEFTGVSAGMNYQVERVAQGFDVPWGMTFVNDNELIVTERKGRITLLNITSGTKKIIDGGPDVRAKGQGGLLDVTTEPDYQPGGWLYFTYSKTQNDQGVTVLSRAKLSGTALNRWQELLVTKSGADTERHYGSRITFDNAGYVYFGVGDRGHRPNGQNLSTHAGSVLRLHTNGRVPDDNLLLETEGALPEIWSYGHRNPQGLVYDKNYNRLWLIEHGPRGGDEVNLIKKGGNYGWPVTSHGKEYGWPKAVGESKEKEGIESPVKVYVPSIAPGSLLLYTSEIFPKWRGSLFSGALKQKHLNRIMLDEVGNIIGEERLFEDLSERIRALVQSPEGWIYFSTDSGKIYRIVPRPEK